MKVVVPYKSRKYNVEGTLLKSGIEYDEIIYIFDKWLEKDWNGMCREVREKLEGRLDEDEVIYLVGAGYIPAVLSIFDYLRSKGMKVILLDYDTGIGAYKRRVIK